MSPDELSRRHCQVLEEWIRLVEDPQRRQRHQDHRAMVQRWRAHRHDLEQTP